MSYYDDYDDDDDEYSSEEDVYYHNYSVDYANQILGGHHALSSCLPLMRRKHHRRSPRLVRVSTLDQLPIVNRHQILPSLHSRPKYGDNQNISTGTLPLTRLPSLESTSEELERRATRRTQPTAQVNEIINNVSPTDDNNDPSSETTHRPLTESELRQVQQQQEAFQQHLLNMQRHLQEQSQQQQQAQQVPASSPSPSPSPPSPSTSHRFQKKTKVTYDIQRDDDQAQIAELIENDPYFAAAMEDFVHTHGLLHGHRHRTHSTHSSSKHSSHLCSRHQTKHHHHHHPRPPSPSASTSSSSTSSSSSSSALTNVTPELKGSQTDIILFRELHGIRRLMEAYFRNQNTTTSTTQPNITILPVPWPMAGAQFQMPGVPFQPSTGVHYPPVPPVTDYQPSVVPRERTEPPHPTQAIYQNVVNSVKEVLDRRSPSQHDLPLKPSQIDPKLKHVYTKRPRIPPSNFRPTSMQRPPLPPQQQQQQQQRRRRSSQMSTPPIVQPPSSVHSQQPQQRRRRSSQMTTPPIVPPPAPPSSSNIPPAPPYEPLANFSAFRPAINKNRNLSYGNRAKNSNIYDTLQPGHYLRFHNTKYN